MEVSTSVLADIDRAKPKSQSLIMPLPLMRMFCGYSVSLPYLHIAMDDAVGVEVVQSPN